MLLLTQGGEIINLERMAIIDAASLNVYARQGMGERGIILGSYIYDEYAHGQDVYSMPKD